MELIQSVFNPFRFATLRPFRFLPAALLLLGLYLIFATLISLLPRPAAVPLPGGSMWAPVFVAAFALSISLLNGSLRYFLLRLLSRTAQSYATIQTISLRADFLTATPGFFGALASTLVHHGNVSSTLPVLIALFCGLLQWILSAWIVARSLESAEICNRRVAWLAALLSYPALLVLLGALIFATLLLLAAYLAIRPG